MTSGKLACKNINNGNASRYIKPRWLVSGKLSTQAFDLREGPPPETYVSHFMAEGEVETELFKSAYREISQRINICDIGNIAFLDISETLSEVNDDAEPFIEFIEKGLPHCGLIYITTNQQQIQEAKATLCLLAQKKLIPAKAIADQIGATIKIK